MVVSVSSGLTPGPFLSVGAAVVAGGVDFADSSLAAAPVETEPGCALLCDEVELLCGEELALPLLWEAGSELLLAGAGDCDGAGVSAVALDCGEVCCGGNFVAEGAVGSCGGGF